MMRTVMKNIKILLLISVLFLLTRCGMENGSQNGSAPGCSPNVIDSGLQVSMMPLSPGSNEYSVTLCANSQPADAVYTVYGGRNEDDVDARRNPYITSATRRPSITSTNSSGNTFQVTFANSDQYFAIYLDQDGFPIMVAPHRIPGR